jgi:xanthine/uracil permease
VALLSRSPVFETQDREQQMRVLRGLREGVPLTDSQDRELATRQAEWECRQRSPWRAIGVVVIVAVLLVAAISAVFTNASPLLAGVPILFLVVLAAGLTQERRSRAQAAAWLSQHGTPHGRMGTASGGREDGR